MPPSPPSGIESPRDSSVDKLWEIRRITPSMKSNPMISLLMAALFINAALTAYLAYKYIRNVSTLQYLQKSQNLMNQELALFTGVVNETMAYGQRHNIVIPPLKTLGIGIRSNQAPAAAKTPSK